MLLLLLFHVVTVFSPPKMTVLKVSRNITVYRHIHTPTLSSDVDGVPQFFLKAQNEKFFLL